MEAEERSKRRRRMRWRDKKKEVEVEVGVEVGGGGGRWAFDDDELATWRGETIPLQCYQTRCPIIVI